MKTRNRLGLTAGAFLAAAAAANAQSVVISQVYGGGGNTGAPMRHDFIELYNPTASAVAIGGWSVQYLSATGSTGWVANAVTAGVVLQPGGYYTMRQAAGASTTQPDTVADQTTGTIAVGSTQGKVILVNVGTLQTGACPAGAQIIDKVGYGPTANCSETAPAPILTNTTAAIRAAAGAQDTNDNSVDFTAGTPAPRTGGGGTPPDPANLAINGVSDAADPTIGIPGNVVFTFAGVSNAGPNNATAVTLTSTLPAGTTYVGSSVGSASESGGLITVPLNTINNGAVTSPFTVTVSANQAYPAEHLLVMDWTVNYLGESDSSNNTARTRTEVVAAADIVAGGIIQDDVAWGWNSVSAIDTVKIVRGATSATPVLVRNMMRNQPFAESMEFDNAGGVLRNPAGNLLATNFGSATTGGLIYSYSTGDLTAATGTIIGQWTDASTFTSGTATSLATRSRIGGLSVNPSNTKIAITGDDAGSVYVFDYNPAGPDFLTNGREALTVFAAASSTGTAWFDDNTLMVACGGAGADLRLRFFTDTGTSLDLTDSNLLSAPGGGNHFTDVEYLPGVSPLVIVSDGRFVTPSTFNTVWVFDPSNPTWRSDPAAGVFDYSGSVNTLREIAYASNGDLILGQFGGSTPSVAPLTANTPALDRVASATTLGAFANNNSTTIFSVTNLTEPGINLSVSFNGLGVASGGAGGCPAGCNVADITEVGGTVEAPGCPDNQLTVDDVIVFVNAFGDGVGCPGVGPCNIADVTDVGDTGAGPDGELTVDDIIAFFNAFSDGCV